MNKKEINTTCQILKDTMIAYVQYPDNNYLKDQFRYAYRNVFFLHEQNYLASVKAYNDFYGKTGEDIRNYKWGQTKKGIKLNSEYVFEHMDTANQFKLDLFNLYEQNILTNENIIDLIFKQRFCWITKEENQCLNAKGFKSNRDNPDEAYQLCGIIIKD